VIGRADLLVATILGLTPSVRLDEYCYQAEESAPAPSAEAAFTPIPSAIPPAESAADVGTEDRPQPQPRPTLSQLWVLDSRSPRPPAALTPAPPAQSDAAPGAEPAAQRSDAVRREVLGVIAAAEREAVPTLARRLALRIRERFCLSRDAGPDVPALTGCVARGELPLRVPRLQAPTLQQPIELVLDLGDSTRPLHGAFRQLATALQRELALSVREPARFDAFGRQPPARKAAVILLSDGRSDAVRAWVRQSGYAGDSLPAICGVQPQAMEQGGKAVAGAKPGSTAIALAAVPAQALAELLGVLRCVPDCHGAFLLPLARHWCQGVEAWALAWAVWNHPDVQRRGGRCWLAQADSAAARIPDAALLQRVLRDYLALHRIEPAGNHELACLYAACAPGMAETLSAARGTADAYVAQLQQRLLTTADTEAALLACAWVRALPPAARSDPAYGRLFAAAHRALGTRPDETLSLPAGFMPPPESPAQAPEPWRLREEAGALVLTRAADADGVLTTHAIVSDLQLAPGEWLHWRSGNAAQARRVAGDRIELVMAEVAGEIELGSASEVLVIRRLQRPSWALGWGRDLEGAFVLAPSPTGKAHRFRVPEGSGLDPNHPLLARDQRERVEALPDGPGAKFALGVDRFGLFATLTIKGVTQRLRWLVPGEFWMGSPAGESKWDHERPRHLVRLTEVFWLADTACTQEMWMSVVGGENPSRFEGDPNLPVEQVSWDDITQDFLPQLQMALGAAVHAQLPSEAQWEYACRAGETTPFSSGETIASEQVNYNGNYPYGKGKKGLHRARTLPVASLPANAWGFYEMHGNVWEWCRDGLRRYGSEPVSDPEGPEDSYRVLRGGSWIHHAADARSAFRNAFVPRGRYVSFGFRFGLRLVSPVMGLAESYNRKSHVPLEAVVQNSRGKVK